MVDFYIFRIESRCALTIPSYSNCGRESVRYPSRLERSFFSAPNREWAQTTAKKDSLSYEFRSAPLANFLPLTVQSSWKNNRTMPMTRSPHPTTMFSPWRLLKGLRSLILGPAVVRRRTRHEVARIVANKLGGHYVGDDYKLWLRENNFVERFKELSPHNYFSMERKFTLKEFARHTSGMEGSVAECGSYVGVSAWFVAREIGGAELFLFDSFEGLSHPKIQDSSPNGVQQWREGDLASTEELLRKNLAEFEDIHILKGWIPERFPEVGDRQFKLVHIDVDLYEPTLRSLEFFYHRMVPGGVIIMDDYGFENCPGAHRAAIEFMSDRSEKIIHLATGQGVIIRQC